MAGAPPTAPPPIVMAPHRGAIILVLGILSFFICVICGIFAWVMANADLREMDAGRMDPSGRSITTAGKICGIISLVLSALGMLAGLCWIVFAALLGAGAAAAAVSSTSGS